MIPKTISIKLYPVEHSALYGFLSKIYTNVDKHGLNCHVNALVLHDYFFRKSHIINSNSHSHTGKPRGLPFKAIEARALYEELRSPSHENVLLGNIFGHLDRSLINAGFNRQIYQ